MMHGANSAKRYECHLGVHLLPAAGHLNMKANLILADQ